MNRLPTTTDTDSNLIAMVKGRERYIIVYDEPSTNEARMQLNRWASHPELSFTWYDAAQMCVRIREEANERFIRAVDETRAEKRKDCEG